MIELQTGAAGPRMGKRWIIEDCSISETPLQMNGPRVGAELVGVFPTVGQTIEDREGNPLTIDTDFFGNPFLRPVPGPLADVRPGRIEMSWSLRLPAAND